MNSNNGGGSVTSGVTREGSSSTHSIRGSFTIGYSCTTPYSIEYSGDHLSPPTSSTGGRPGYSQSWISQGIPWLIGWPMSTRRGSLSRRMVRNLKGYWSDIIFINNNNNLVQDYGNINTIVIGFICMDNQPNANS